MLNRVVCLFCSSLALYTSVCSIPSVSHNVRSASVYDNNPHDGKSFCDTSAGDYNSVSSSV